jgi:hypothetical protein
MDFRELADLRLLLRELLSKQVESLSVYYDEASGGFYHRHDKFTPGHFSKSSSATCVLSLVATNEWQRGKWGDTTPKLIEGFLAGPWESAGLDTDNVFTVAFILEAVTELLRIGPDRGLEAAAQARLQRAQKILTDEAEKGALSVQGYPPSAYVTQLVLRTLKKHGLLNSPIQEKISDWAEREINKQVALLSRNDKTGDIFQLAYAGILLANLVEPDRLTPDQEFILETALAELFTKQRDDGTWPLSRPLFHYPTVGSAHCFDYEMLVQLLGEPRLRQKVLRFIPKLSKSARALQSFFPLGVRGAGWSSGHHPQLHGPESWSTASVYHFAHAFERLIAEQIRLETFSYLTSPYKPPENPITYDVALPAVFLDCPVKLDNQTKSLKDVVSNHVLKPLIQQEQERTIESGRALSKRTPMSIIFFGPPGTSKTRLADIIASRLGWPLLSIDSSQFLKHGMDGVYAEADRIFGMLAVAERIVVLLDEFDEMVRERGIATDVLSRFLTTAMLPKLHKINDNRRLVFIVATNHIEAFDIAIRRPGRFDVILQVMPPTAEEKTRKWPELTELTGSGGQPREIRERVEDLTYDETDTFVRHLNPTSDLSAKLALLEATHKKCTLLDKATTEKTWKEVCEEQSLLSRVP